MTTYNLKNCVSPAFYDLHKTIKKEKANEVVLQGGRGSTKSSFASIEVILFVLKNPMCHAAVFRKVGNTLRNSVYTQICWAIEALGLSSKFKCTVSPMECTYLPTGQKILFFGLDDPNKIKSIKVAFGYIGTAWFEELDQFAGAEEIRSVEQSVLRGGEKAITFKSFNPPAMARNWANQYALETKDFKIVHHSTYLTTPKSWLGQRFFDDAEYLKASKEIAYKHEYLGEVVGSGRAVFENLKIEEVPQSKIKMFDRVLHGVDWGWYPDPWAFNSTYFDSSRRVLYIFDELTRQKTSNQDTAKLLKERNVCNNGETDETLTADGAEEKSCADYRDFGLPCQRAEKGPGSVRYSSKWLAGLNAIIIDPIKCPDTVKEFGEYEYEIDKKTGDVLNGYPDINNHHIDAVRYATEKIWKRRGN